MNSQAEREREKIAEEVKKERFLPQRSPLQPNHERNPRYLCFCAQEKRGGYGNAARKEKSLLSAPIPPSFPVLIG